MDTNAFIESVRAAGAFDSEETARRTTFATLEVLGECISRGQVEAVADQLSEELAERFVASASGEAEPLPYEVFLERIADRAGFEKSRTQSRVQAVVATLADTVDEFAFDSLHGQLPRAYDPIFQTDAVPAEESVVESVSARESVDPDTAIEATRATLMTLGERISLGEAQDTAAYLPERESGWLIEFDSPDAEAFSSDEFVLRVAGREEVTSATARNHVRAVTGSLEEIVPHEEIIEIREQLPMDYQVELFPGE